MNNISQVFKKLELGFCFSVQSVKNTFKGIECGDHFTKFRGASGIMLIGKKFSDLKVLIFKYKIQKNIRFYFKYMFLRKAT